LSEKHGIPFGTLRRHAESESWTAEREKAEHEANTKAAQKTAELAADNANIAADIKRRLLERLKRVEVKYPMDATEVRTRMGNSVAIFRLRDLTAAYKDLTEDMPKAKADTDDPLMAMLKRWDDAARQ
jgi:hypothetical protein